MRGEFQHRTNATQALNTCDPQMDAKNSSGLTLLGDHLSPEKTASMRLLSLSFLHYVLHRQTVMLVTAGSPCRQQKATGKRSWA